MKKKAFTLIELMVVVLVIGILTAMVAIGLQSARARARDSVRKGDMHNLKNAIEQSFDDVIDTVKTKEHYAIQATPVDITTLTWLTSENYVKAIPNDVNTDNPYQYLTDATGDNFAMFAVLENTKDGDIKTTNPDAGTMPTGYNFWVQND